ncbi:SH3 domain-containing protein [Laspinema sp. D1]|uniref:SH3 domain-containing protein n=1 Tax=Laspinema palackyanum TaxID=3231601 RepID=UPI00348E527F|nr:SH3 domain-containing protein [Laspinema sp. D2b]
MRSLASLVQFILGFTLALIILAGGSVAAALYFVTKLTALPARPSFTNDQPAVTATAGENSQGGGTSQGSGNAPAALPANAYRAKVIWPDGLILRDRPGYEANSIGGLDFNAQVVVLETSSDKEWEKVRIEGSGQDGWIKGGNTERLN